MRATVDWRRPATVTVKMDLDEFRETVEWLEDLDPRDGATKHWRAALDRLLPPEEPDPA